MTPEPKVFLEFNNPEFNNPERNYMKATSKQPYRNNCFRSNGYLFLQRVTLSYVCVYRNWRDFDFIVGYLSNQTKSTGNVSYLGTQCSLDWYFSP